MEKEERIVLIGYLLGILSREANQRGTMEIDLERIEELLGLFHAETKLSVEEQNLIQFIESISFKINMELGDNRQKRREQLKHNKKVYKIS